MHVDSFVVCRVGKMAQDVGMVYCVVIPIHFGRVFEVYLHLFWSRKLSCDLLLKQMREEGGRGGQREDTWDVEYASIELCCSQKYI